MLRYKVSTRFFWSTFLIILLLFSSLSQISFSEEQVNSSYKYRVFSPLSKENRSQVFYYESSLGRTSCNKTLSAIKISDNPHLNESEPAILFIGGHHGDEVLSVDMANYLIDFLLNSYDTRADIRQLINEREIWIIPCLNPDGYQRTLNGQPWRKNLRDNGDGSFGVDLNRNYGYMRGTDAHTSDDPRSENYHGPEAFSEPETQAVRELVESINFTASISFHSSGELILYPWGYTTQRQTDRYELQKEIATDMATMNGYTPQQASKQYVTHGDAEDWLYSQGVMSFTFELGTEDDPEDPLPVLEANLAPCLYLIDIADNLSRAHLPQWTMMYYMAGDNSLSSEVADDLRQMKQVGSNKEMNIIALTDKVDDSDSRAYYVEKDGLENIALSEINASWGDELDMASQDTMESFFSWVKENYPARNYMLEVWGHSSSWRYAGFDGDTDNNFTAETVASALENTDLYVDIVSFDSCAMGSVEAAAALSGSAIFMLASEKDLPVDGFPYHEVLKIPAEDPFIMPYDFVSQIPAIVMESYENGSMDAGKLPVSLTVVDLGKMPEVLQDMEETAQKLKNKLPLHRQEIRRALRLAGRYEQEDYGDLVNFLEHLGDNVDATDLDHVAQVLNASLGKAIVCLDIWQNPEAKTSLHSMNCLSLYLPAESKDFEEGYGETAFARETGWYSFLEEYYHGREGDLYLEQAVFDEKNLSLELELNQEWTEGMTVTLEVCGDYGSDSFSWDGLKQENRTQILEIPKLSAAGELELSLTLRNGGLEEKQENHRQREPWRRRTENHAKADGPRIGSWSSRGFSKARSFKPIMLNRSHHCHRS